MYNETIVDLGDRTALHRGTGLHLWLRPQADRLGSDWRGFQRRMNHMNTATVMMEVECSTRGRRVLDTHHALERSTISSAAKISHRPDGRPQANHVIRSR